MTSDGSGHASYVYAVCRPLDGGAVEGLTGVGGRPLHLVTEEDLTAVVSAVPLEEFDEEALTSRLEDLRLLEEMARAHHGVVDTVARLAVTVPLRLATVYRGDERVREVLRAHAETFEATLRELAGRVELGVKVYADAGTRSPTIEPSGGSVPGESRGRAYLRRRKEQRERRDDTWRRAAVLCERTDEVLSGLSHAREQHPPQNAALSEVPGENVMNHAYLVDQDRVEAFLAAVRDLRSHAREGVRIEVSGPWAPYSFASPRSSEVGV